MSSNLKYTGANIATSYYPSGQAPLDVRSIVDSFSSIKSSLNAFKTSTGDDTSYIGMMVTAYDSGNVYVLTSKNPITWKEIGSDLSKLSGVFTFKGVAEAVSSDLKYIAICSDISDQSIVPVGIAVDLVGDLYYGWSIEENVFWTESSILDSNSTQYIRSEPVLVWGIEYKDDFYFPVNAMPAGGDDELIELQNSNGDSIFLTDNALPVTVGTWYSVYNSKETEIGTGLGFSYTGYTFTEAVDSYPIIHTHTTIQANQANSGHVYQIGENEYASNGQIWVKLGSPVEDWIII